MPTQVKFYDSTMGGAPQLNNSWGAMTTVLDAVLINGFNLKPITTLSRVGALVTAQCSAHDYRVGATVVIEGAVPAAYNDEFVVTAVTTNSFSFEVTGTPATPATGTMTAKVASLGWDIAFTGMNKRAYRSRAIESNRPYLRVDDGLDPLYNTNYAKYAKVTMAQGMSDIDTFVGARAPFDPAFQTRNEVATGSGGGVLNGWFKWYYARGGENLRDSDGAGDGLRSWCVVGDSRGFYIFNESLQSLGGLGGKCFTDFDSYRAGDGFNTLLCAQDSYAPADFYKNEIDNEGYRSADQKSRFSRTIDTTGKLLMRPFTQVGSPKAVSFTSLNTNNGQTLSGRTTGIRWPNGPDYGLILNPVTLCEGNHLRGKMPGMMWVHNDSPDLMHLSIIEGVVGYASRRFLVVRHSSGESSIYGVTTTATLLFDVTGPWR